MDISSIITQVNDPHVVSVDVNTFEISPCENAKNNSPTLNNQNSTISANHADQRQGDSTVALSEEGSSNAQEDSTKPQTAAPATAPATVTAVTPARERSKPRLLRELFCCFCPDRRTSARRNQRQQQHLQHHRYHHNGGQTFSIDLLGPRDPNLGDRICAVIDLDETLVHSSFKYVDDPDFIIDVEIEGLVHQVYVLKRPFTDEFLERMGQLFECVLFTASLAKYADPVSDRLDRWSAFKYRLFRESCVFHGDNFVKDLAQLGRPVDRCVIIDNSPASYMFNTENAIRVRTWVGDQLDTELRDLLPYMERLSAASSVSEFICENPPPFSLQPPPQQQPQQQQESFADEAVSVIFADSGGASHDNAAAVAAEIGDAGDAGADANTVELSDIQPTVELSGATS